MNKNELFAVHRSSKRLNEGLERTFGKKINLENFTLEQLQDARNKLRTQISQVRSESNFNENLENDAYHQAKFMLDAINSEIIEREEFISDASTATVEEGYSTEVEEFLQKVAQDGNYDMLHDAQLGKYGKEIEKVVQDMYDDVSIDHGLHPDDNFEEIYDRMLDNIESDYGDSDNDPDEGGETDDNYALASAGFGSDEDYGDFGRDESLELEDRKPDQNFTPDDIKNLEKIDDIETLKVRAFDLISKPSKRPMKPEKVDWFKRNLEMKKDKVSIIKLMWDLLLAGEGMRVVGGSKGSERYRQRFGDSIENQGEGMDKLQEGEVQQAQSIVTAKTMVDRVGRWIEELSGMENDTLLTLGDQIRDEMGQEQARAFLSQVAPAIQTALDNLKQTRETLASGMRMLTGQEQSAEMLGGAPESEETAPPDMMNTAAPAGDEFAAAEPAAGGEEAAGRAQRESIQFQNRLLKVLAG